MGKGRNMTVPACALLLLFDMRSMNVCRQVSFPRDLYYCPDIAPCPQVLTLQPCPSNCSLQHRKGDIAQSQRPISFAALINRARHYLAHLWPSAENAAHFDELGLAPGAWGEFLLLLLAVLIGDRWVRVFS